MTDHNLPSRREVVGEEVVAHRWLLEEEGVQNLTWEEEEVDWYCWQLEEEVGGD